MASLYRARVTAVGTDEDMLRLNRCLLQACDHLQEPEDGPEPGLEELYHQVHRLARWEGTEDSGFLYDMVSPLPFGQADSSTCRYIMRREPCGLWTATFAYDSDTPFQPEDWLNLHRRCDRLPMLALRAGWDFARDKGLMIFTGGQALENWDRMAECWLWLLHQYEYGYPPEEAVERLCKLEATLEREDFDLSIAQLLEACVENLQQLGQAADVTAEGLDAARKARDFQGLFEQEARLAECALWETEHSARWIACLESVQRAWQEHLGR